MRKTLMSCVGTAVLVLAGCSNQTPSCADAQTVNLVKQIYQQQFDKQHKDVGEERQKRVQFTVNDSTVTLENITTDAINTDTGKAMCSAQLTTVFPEDAVNIGPQLEQYMRAIYEPQGAVLDGTKLQGQVTYTVQRTEDTGALQVALSGFMPFMNYFHDIAMSRYARMLSAQEAAKKDKEAQMAAAPSTIQAEVGTVTQDTPSEPSPVAALLTPTAQQPQLPSTEQASASSLAPSQSAAVTHLCSSEETVVFACSTGKKRASLCMAGNNELTYRLAPLDGAPEMVYPVKAAAASTAFKQGTHTSTSGQPLPFVSFDTGSYRYAAYGSTTTEQGILVEQNGKRIANLRCQVDRLSELGTSKLQSLELAQDLRPLMLP